METLNGLARGEITPVPQENDKATYAPMVDREVGRINWNSSSEHVHNTVRGCDPFPGAFSYLNGEKIKIWRTKLCVEDAILRSQEPSYMR